jgi:bifunctional non-homologous end joining protein LigD
VAGKAQSVDIEGRTLQLSNLDKVLYPAEGFTKGAVIDYYARVAPAILTHLRGRAVTLKRHPDGVDGKFFYEKNCPKHRPDWMHTKQISTGRKEVNFCVVDDLPSLIWTQNLASIELHTSLALAKDHKRPTMMVFDLDPGPPAAMKECCEVALELRALFEQLGLEAFPKTSGSKGLQPYVPLGGKVTFDQTKDFARTVAQLLEERDRKRVISQMKKELRTGKVFVDWSQNDEHKTTVCAYSLRAKERPTASTPVTWEEVEAGAAGEPLSFTAGEVLERVEADGDLFAPTASLKQKLPSL